MKIDMYIHVCVLVYYCICGAQFVPLSVSSNADPNRQLYLDIALFNHSLRRGSVANACI